MAKSILANPPLTAAYLRQRLEYCLQTGEFRWHYFRGAEKKWNSRYAGILAGSVKSDGYRYICIDDCRYLAHRLAWLYVHGKWPDRHIVHVNVVRSDNRFCNLRLATYAQNGANSHVAANNTSGFKGVSFHKKSRLWRAYIGVSGRQLALGLFSTPESAHAAYVAAAWKYFGEFARSA